MYVYILGLAYMKKKKHNETIRKNKSFKSEII